MRAGRNIYETGECVVLNGIRGRNGTGGVYIYKRKIKGYMNIDVN